MTAAVAGALLGALWALDYRLAPAIAALWIVLHAVLGGVIGAVTRVLPVPRLRAPTRVVEALAVVGSLALLPAILGQLAKAFPVSIWGLMALAGAGSLATLVVARGAGWGGNVACWGCALCLGVGLVASRSPASGMLPTYPVRSVRAEPTSVHRLAVIGLDGADWRVIEPLIARGEMRNLAALRARGTWAVLHSIEPTYSPIVWTSIFSGKRPEKHGITGWYSSQAANRKAALLWEMVDATGAASVVLNVPGSWPPRPAHGVLVSGFPLPSAIETPRAPEGQHVGMLLKGGVQGTVQPDGEENGVPVMQLRPMPGGERAADLLVSMSTPRGRSRLRHFVVDYLAQRRGVALKRQSVRIAVGPAPSGDGPEHVEMLGHAVDLRPGEWSGWLEARMLDVAVQFQVRRLDGDAVFLTPFFEDLVAPYHRVVSDATVSRRLAKEDSYVVEGIGWKATSNPALRQPFAEHERELTRSRAKAVGILLREVPDWKLLVVVYTITDRISHAFWRFYDPAPYPPVDPAELRENASRVEEAYREADLALGETLQQLGPETTVVVVSDHGFTADPAEGTGTHRKQGIFVAAGPGIRPRPDPLDLSALDVTPTLLTALGLPVPDDMDGEARGDVLEGISPRTRIASYELSTRSTKAAHTMSTRIDASTEDQLRSLGYIR